MALKVTAAIIERHNKVLICKRPNHKKQGGKWEFPGGKIEHGESPEDCLRRELNEELGIDVIIGDYFASSAFGSLHDEIELHAYKVSYPEGEFSLLEHIDARWIKVDELGDYEFASADVQIVEKLRSK